MMFVAEWHHAGVAADIASMARFVRAVLVSVGAEMSNPTDPRPVDVGQRLSEIAWPTTVSSTLWARPVQNTAARCRSVRVSDAAGKGGGRTPQPFVQP